MSQDPVSEIRQPPRPRWDSIDFWRGLLFCTIFINHVPGNIFENLTSRNIGFSDAAEGFIFLSGVSLALAYGGRFAGAGAWKATRTMVGRAVRLYGAHIALSLGALAIFGIGAMVGVDPSLTDDHGRGFVFAHPIEGLIGIVSLGHQLGYFNILPLYLLMLLWAPFLLWLSRRSVPLMLTLSAAVYVVTRLKGWNLPTWPVAGSWFFDPLAWQVLLAVGIACGLRQHTTPLPRTLPLVGVALLVAAFAAWSVSNGLFLRPGLQDATRRWADLDKTMLGTGRLIHFAALAYLLYAARAAERLRGLTLFKPLCAIGRGSLPMFCFLSALAAVSQEILNLFGHTPARGAVVVAAGLGAMYGVALYLDAAAGRRGAARRRLGVPREAFDLPAMLPAPVPGRTAVLGAPITLMVLDRLDPKSS